MRLSSFSVFAPCLSQQARARRSQTEPAMASRRQPRPAMASSRSRPRPARGNGWPAICRAIPEHHAEPVPRAYARIRKSVQARSISPGPPSKASQPEVATVSQSQQQRGLPDLPCSAIAGHSQPQSTPETARASNGQPQRAMPCRHRGQHVPKILSPGRYAPANKKKKKQR